VGRAAAIAAAVIAGIASLPALLGSDRPPPLPADVGLVPPPQAADAAVAAPAARPAAGDRVKPRADHPDLALAADRRSRSHGRRRKRTHPPRHARPAQPAPAISAQPSSAAPPAYSYVPPPSSGEFRIER
jgi:hypothetical protein